MNYFICGICGYIAMDSAPEKCPVCTAPKEKFSQNDAIFEESKAKATEGAAKHVPSIWVDKETKLYPGTEFVTVHAKIGEVPHPMEEKHFIQFVDIKNYSNRKLQSSWILDKRSQPIIKTAGRANSSGDQYSCKYSKNNFKHNSNICSEFYFKFKTIQIRINTNLKYLSKLKLIKKTKKM